MSESEIARLQRVVEDISLRLRAVENVDSPYQRQLVGELKALEAKVAEIDSLGATVTRIHVQALQKDVADLERAIRDRDVTQAEDAKWTRRMMLTALFTAALGLALFIAEFLINRAAGP